MRSVLAIVLFATACGSGKPATQAPPPPLDEPAPPKGASSVPSS